MSVRILFFITSENEPRYERASARQFFFSVLKIILQAIAVPVKIRRLKVVISFRDKE